VTETVGLAVLTGCVVGVREASHENDASFLTQGLNSHSHTGGRTTCDHDGAVFFDHGTGRRAGCVRFRLRVAGHVFDFATQDTCAVQHFGAECVQHAAVAATVQVLNGQLVGAQLVRALIGVGAGLWYVEAQNNLRVAWSVGETGMAVGAQVLWQREGCTTDGTSLDDTAACEVRFRHCVLP